MDGRARGSAFLIAPNLLLTTSYVVLHSNETSPSSQIQVRLVGTETPLNCDAIWWKDSAPTRVALLRTDRAHDRERAEVADLPNFARFVGTGARSCEVIGFTRAWGDRDSLEAIRISGTVDPGTWPESRFLLFEASARRSTAGGMGGAGLCCDGYLVGLIEMFNPDENTFRVIPVAELLKDNTFSKVLKHELGSTPEVQDLLPPETAISDVLKDVSKADPANIQEVAASQFALSDRYYENVLAQAKRSFDAAVAASVVGLVFFLAAIVFAISTHQLTAPIMSAVGGGVVEVVGGLNFWLYGRTSVQLASFHLRLDRMQRFLIANSVSASLTDDHRDLALSELIKVMSTPNLTTDPPTTDPPTTAKK